MTALRRIWDWLAWWIDPLLAMMIAFVAVMVAYVVLIAL